MAKPGEFQSEAITRGAQEYGIALASEAAERGLLAPDVAAGDLEGDPQDSNSGRVSVAAFSER